MRRTIVVLVMLLGAGCTNQNATAPQQSQPQVQLIGMTKQQIQSCMGSPSGMQQTNNGEIWSYPAGLSAGPSPNNQAMSNALNSNAEAGPGTGTGDYAATGPSGGFGAAGPGSHSCAVNVVFNAGKVSAVNYQATTGGPAVEGWECTNAVQSCGGQ